MPAGALITDMVSERTRLLPVLIPGGQSSMYSGVPSGLDGHSETTGSASMIGMAVPTLLKAGQKLAKGCGKEEYLETFFLHQLGRRRPDGEVTQVPSSEPPRGATAPS